jgi:hypothetical protein
MDWSLIAIAVTFGGVQIWTISQVWALWKVSAMIHEQQKSQFEAIRLHQTIIKGLIKP